MTEPTTWAGLLAERDAARAELAALREQNERLRRLLVDVRDTLDRRSEERTGTLVAVALELLNGPRFVAAVPSVPTETQPHYLDCQKPAEHEAQWLPSRYEPGEYTCPACAVPTEQPETTAVPSGEQETP